MSENHEALHDQLAVRIVDAGEDAGSEHLSAALSVERAAFGTEEEADLVRDLLGDPSARPCLSLVAYSGLRPVGHVLFTAAPIEGAASALTAAILAPLAVVPEAQRQGVGGALIEDGVARLAADSVDLVFVLGHPSYYPRHGFVPAKPFELTAPYPIEPQEAWMVRELRPGLLGSASGSVACAQTLMRPELWRE